VAGSVIVYLLKTRRTAVGWEMLDTDRMAPIRVPVPDLYGFNIGDRVCGTLVSVTVTPHSIVLAIEED
jgi:hypothetical protein